MHVLHVHVSCVCVLALRKVFPRGIGYSLFLRGIGYSLDCSPGFYVVSLMGAATGGACAAKAAITSAATRLQPRLPHHKRSVHCSEMYTHTMQYTLTLSLAIAFMFFIYCRRRRRRWPPKNGHRIVGSSLGCRTTNGQYIALKCTFTLCNIL